jgi:hypothetical protein
VQIRINSEQESTLYLLSHFIDVIKIDLLKRFDNYEKAYDFLLTNYNERLIEKEERLFKIERYDQEKSTEDKIFSLFCHMNRIYPFLLYKIVLDIAKKEEKHYLSLFIILDHKLVFNSEGDWGSFLVFSKENVSFVYQLLEDSYEAGLLVDYKKMTEVLGDILSKSKIKEKPVNETRLFLDKMKKNLDNLEYISFEETDEYLNYFRIYKANAEINYKDIVLSDGFQKYIKESDFDKDTVSEFDEFFQIYVEEKMEIDCQDYICNQIIDRKLENIALTKEGILDLSIDIKSLF